MPEEKTLKCQQCGTTDRYLLQCINCKKSWCKECLGCMKEYGCMVLEWRCPNCNDKVAIPIPIGQMFEDVKAIVQKRRENQEARTSSRAYQNLTGRRRRK